MGTTKYIIYHTIMIIKTIIYENYKTNKIKKFKTE